MASRPSAVSETQMREAERRFVVDSTSSAWRCQLETFTATASSATGSLLRARDRAARTLGALHGHLSKGRAGGRPEHGCQGPR
eukprot:15441790-Alexandrium_andersonii.AAC.1